MNWTQISGVKVIVELGLEKFPVDPSFGSHFFQNVTGMRIGYFTINHKGKSDLFNLKWIRKQTIKDKKSFTAWIETEIPLEVIIDGQNGKGKIQVQPEIAEEIKKLYDMIITAGTHKAESIKVAEASKVIENTQRDLNIALINELTLIFN